MTEFNDINSVILQVIVLFVALTIIGCIGALCAGLGWRLVKGIQFKTMNKYKYVLFKSQPLEADESGGKFYCPVCKTWVSTTDTEDKNKLHYCPNCGQKLSYFLNYN